MERDPRWEVVWASIQPFEVEASITELLEVRVEVTVAGQLIGHKILIGLEDTPYMGVLLDTMVEMIDKELERVLDHRDPGLVDSD